MLALQSRLTCTFNKHLETYLHQRAKKVQSTHYIHTIKSLDSLSKEKKEKMKIYLSNYPIIFRVVPLLNASNRDEH